MQNYNFFQKLFHDIVLGNSFVNRSLYEIEKIFYLKDRTFKDETHIFISGLPRSGTTSILNFFYSFNNFASLKYSNMPFILSPNISKIFNKKSIARKQRAHSDEIQFDLDSPEAFDEIFFKNGDDFIKDELLNYINLILNSQRKKKYLSKNNLNYKRITIINSILYNSIFLIPIRDPLQHSYSLLNQHIHFKKMQRNDDFIRKYMNYLSHNEFGLDHIPWNSPNNFNDPNDINYWLEQWIMFYNKIFLNLNNNKNCIFLIYEKLTKHHYVENLLKKLKLDKSKYMNQNFFINKNKNNIEIDTDYNLLENAKIIYSNFEKNSLNNIF